MKLHYYLDRRKGKQARLPIFLHFRHRDQLLRVFTGEHCDNVDWDPKSERLKITAGRSGQINMILDSLEDEVFGYVYRKKLLRQPFTVKEIKENLSISVNGQPGFFKVWDEFVFEHIKSGAWKQNTITGFLAVRSHLTALNEKMTLSFRKTDRSLLQGFTEHLVGLGLSPSYIKKNLDLLKWFLHWSGIKGYLSDQGYRQFRFPLTKPIIKTGADVFLSGQELGRLIGLELKDERMNAIRDAFCFSCLTGMSYADLKELTWQNINGHTLSYRPVKTSTGVAIELTDRAMKLLDKTGDKSQQKLFILPVIQSYNLKIKEIAREACIDEPVVQNQKPAGECPRKWELLTSRTGRNTFVQSCIRSGVSLEIMSELLGYSAATLKKHYRVTADKRVKAMEMIEKKVNYQIYNGNESNKSGT